MNDSKTNFFFVKYDSTDLCGFMIDIRHTLFKMTPRSSFRLQIFFIDTFEFSSQVSNEDTDLKMIKILIQINSSTHISFILYIITRFYSFIEFLCRL
jgi:hypothetical protein